MKNTDETLDILNQQVYENLIELKHLLKEKNDIMARYKAASSFEKVLIEKEMLESKEKFEALSNQVDELSNKINKLKSNNS